MARQEILTAKCDRKGCKTVIEIDRTTEAPEGWLQVTVEVEGKYDPRAKMEFCSEKCISIWARDRKQAVTGINGNGQHNYREDVMSAIDIIISENKDAVTPDAVAEIAEINPSTAGTWLRKLNEEGVLEIIAGNGKRGSPYVYGKTE